MDNTHSFWQLGDELRGQSKTSEDQSWLRAASRLAEQTRLKGERMNNLDLSKGTTESRPRDKIMYHEDNNYENFNFNFNMLNLDSRIAENMSKSSLRNGIYNMNAVYQKNSGHNMGNLMVNKYSGNNLSVKEADNNSNNSNDNNSAVDKRFKTLPATETLPRNEVLGGYIFVCNNDTMQEDLKRQLFGNYYLLILFSNVLLSFSFN